MAFSFCAAILSSVCLSGAEKPYRFAIVLGMNPPLTVHVFQDRIALRVNAVICVGEREEIEEALGLGQLKEIFEGEVVYRNDSIKKDYVGVWGARNASRLRRLLRDQGVALLIQRTRPPDTRLLSFSTQSGHVQK